jgi:hypothetical protein
MTPQPIRIVAVLAFLSGMTLLSGCMKDSLSQTAPTAAATTVTGGARTANLIVPVVCQITDMGNSGFYMFREGILNKINYTNITYNSISLPARCKHSEESYDSLVSNFYYDASNRLLKITTGWYPKSHVFADFITEYSFFNYLANGTTQVVQYYQSPLDQTPQGRSTLLLEFDASHRVVKQTRSDANGVAQGYLRYVYDANGNQSNIYIWSVDHPEQLYYHFNTYDTKRNFCTTNSVWQLLLDQYSLNNPTDFVSSTFQDDYEFMGYQYNAQNEPTVTSHWDQYGHTTYTTTNDYSCRLIF